MLLYLFPQIGCHVLAGWLLLADGLFGFADGRRSSVVIGRWWLHVLMGLLLLLLQLVLQIVVAVGHLLRYEADGSQAVGVAN